MWIIRTIYLANSQFLNVLEVNWFLPSSVAVISDALCEQRLWDMKSMGYKNFYMCEVRKDFTIDATFKGNPSRFLNHSCEPNCNLEKWLVSPIINLLVSVSMASRAVDWHKKKFSRLQLPLTFIFCYTYVPRRDSPFTDEKKQFSFLFDC